MFGLTSRLFAPVNDNSNKDKNIPNIITGENSNQTNESESIPHSENIIDSKVGDEKAE